ncbi:MAG: DUF4405 domain-containing protein [Candidatus Latescibacteria bacterium]|nr:DUF4405 domain-containing protein [Candidatus Latescibacterota bacterium]
MKFNTRGLISITLMLSFLALSVSGIVLYIMPHGRVAYWINWEMLGLSKDNWDAVHTVTGIVFMVAAFMHFCFNWKIFLNYLRSKITKGLTVTKELIASLVIIVVIIGGTIADIAPFGYVMDAGESIKESWSSDSERAPFAHAELLTVKALQENLGLSSDSLRSNLEKYGIKIESTDETLKSIAERHDMTPQELFRIIQPSRGEGEGQGKGLGLGEGKGLGKGLGRGKGRMNRTDR